MKKDNFLKLLTTISVATTSLNVMANEGGHQHPILENNYRFKSKKLLTKKQYSYIFKDKITIKDKIYDSKSNTFNDTLIEGRIHVDIYTQNISATDSNLVKFNGSIVMRFVSDNVNQNDQTHSTGYTLNIIEDGMIMLNNSDSNELRYSIFECSSTLTNCTNENMISLNLDKKTNSVSLRANLSNLSNLAFFLKESKGIAPYFETYDLNLISIKDYSN